MMRTSYIVYLLIVLSVSFTSAPSVAGEITGNPVGCLGDKSKFQFLNLRGKILLNQHFLPETKAENQKIQEEAIELQLKHLMSFFRTTSLKMNAALASYRSEVQILRKEKVKYSNSFQVDDYLPASRGPVVNSYTKKALARGFVDHGDKALLIHYQTKILVADCSPENISSHQILLPTDPYLSLWIEDKGKRRSRSFGPGKLDYVSNCSSNEIVLFGNYDVSWFFWSPISNGKGQCKHDQKKMYSPDLAVVNDVRKIENIDKTFFKSDSLRVTAVFGIIDQSEIFAKNDFQYFKKFVINAFDRCKKINSVPGCLSQWTSILAAQSDEKYYEPGAYHFFNYLKYLNTLVIVDSVKVNELDVNSNDLFLKITGKLIDSDVPIEISSYYGKTSLDYGPRVSSSYLKLLHDSFRDFDSISYVGHAGLGQNLSMQNLNKFWNEDKLALVSRTKPLWLGIYNCEAFSYFGFDLDKIFKKGHMNVLLTETSGTDTGSKFPLSQLALINNLYADKAKDNSREIQKVMGRYVIGRDFLTTFRIKE